MLNWAVLSIAYTHFTTMVTVVTTTNEPVHLTLYYTHISPVRHRDTRIIRGIGLPWGAYFCFVSWKAVEQNEAGDTLIHTFDVPLWSYCITYWFCFIGTVGAAPSPSISPIFEHHHPGVLTTTNRSIYKKAYYQTRRSANPGDPDVLYPLVHGQDLADLYWEGIMVYGQQVRVVGTYALAQIRRYAMVFNTRITGGHELLSATLRVWVTKGAIPIGYSADWDWFVKIRAGQDLNTVITHGDLDNYSDILNLGTEVGTKYANDLPNLGVLEYWYMDIPIQFINTAGLTVITSLTSKDETVTRPGNNKAELAAFYSDSFTRLTLVYYKQ